MKSAGLQGREEGNASEEAMEGGAEINSVDNAGPVPLKHSIERIIQLVPRMRHSLSHFTSLLSLLAVYNITSKKRD